MSAKAIREAAGKHLLNTFLDVGSAVKSNLAVVTAETDWTSLVQEHPWLLSEVCIQQHFRRHILYKYEQR